MNKDQKPKPKPLDKHAYDGASSEVPLLQRMELEFESMFGDYDDGPFK